MIQKVFYLNSHRRRFLKLQRREVRLTPTPEEVLRPTHGRAGHFDSPMLHQGSLAIRSLTAELTVPFLYADLSSF